MNCVVPTKSFVVGEVGGDRDELIRHWHDVEIADQCVEFGYCRAVLRLGETPNPLGGSERSSRHDHDEVHRRKCVGGDPDGHP
jgi:hypothetical protein